MKAHIAYLKYLLRHKWFVLLATRHVGASLWRGLVHDLSKFRPSEWWPYVHTFYSHDGKSQYVTSCGFDKAWNLHQKRNPHHWQFWLLTRDEGTTEALPMPHACVLEMVADWLGAGRAITGRWSDCRQWYAQNSNSMILHQTTRITVEDVLSTMVVPNDE